MLIGDSYPHYKDENGLPLNDGYIYFGAVNQNPETTPVTVYWDFALTQPAAQPIRTINGYLSRDGSISNVYTASNYSITAKNKKGVLLFSLPDSSVFDKSAYLTAQLALSGGSALIGFIQAGAGAVYRTAQSKMRDIVNVADFGFASSNSAAQNKTAIALAVASLTRPGKLVLPGGFFNCDPGIDLGTFVIGIEGQGKYQTYLSNSSGTTASAFFSTPDIQQTEYCFFKHFGMDGGAKITSAIRMLKANHNTYEGMLITGTTGVGLYVGGYSNDITDNDIFSNTGTGIVLQGALNNTNVTKNRIYANGGVGVILQCTDTSAGLQINIKENAIEGNALAGVMAFNTKALNIKDNYFERNGTTGYQYSSPELILVRADIHLLANNSLSIDRSPAYSNDCPTVSGNHATAIGVLTALANQDGFIFTSYANNLRVENNQMFDDTKLNALVSIYQNRAYSTVENKLIIAANSRNDVNFIGSFNVNTERFDSAHLIDIKDNSIFSNFADTNFFNWGILAGSTGTLIKTGNYWDNQHTWGLTDGDIQWGAVVDLTVHPELRGNWVWLGMWVNDQGANTNARLFLNGQSSRSATPAGGTAAWTFQSVLQFVGVADATLGYGVEKIGTGAVLLINGPCLTIVGNDCRKFQSSIPTYKRGGAPVSGTWQVGDRVLNSAPAVGQPKAWQCTVAGTPGTWVSEGNL